jgi:hypothetical protein
VLEEGAQLGWGDEELSSDGCWPEIAVPYLGPERADRQRAIGPEDPNSFGERHFLVGMPLLRVGAPLQAIEAISGHAFARPSGWTSTSRDRPPWRRPLQARRHPCCSGGTRWRNRSG